MPDRMKPRTTIGLAALVLVLMVGGFLVYVRPIGSVARLDSVEDCVYTTTATSREVLGSDDVYLSMSSTSGAYSTTATVKMTAGAVTTSTTTITPLPGEANIGFPPSGGNGGTWSSRE